MNTSQRVTLRKAAFAIALILGVWPLAARATDADKLLKSLEERRAKVKSLHTVTEMVIRQPKAVRKTRFEYWESTTGETRKTKRVGRAEILEKGKDKPHIAESATISDGEFQWSELPGTGTKTIIKSLATESHDFGGIHDAMRGGKARTRPGEKLLGMKTVVIEVVSRAVGASSKATYWIAEQNGIILKSRVTSSDGRNVEMDTSVCEIDIKIPESTFVFTAPDGAQVIDTTTIGRNAGTGNSP